MLITRRQLNEIIHRELNEGFFDAISNLFTSDETREEETQVSREEAQAEAQRTEESDRQKIRDYYSDYLVLSRLSFVDQNWHQNAAFLCEDTTGKKTLWYQSGRERILVQIAGVGVHPFSPGDPDAPGAIWLCKSTPLKRPYGGSTEEKIYELLNTYVNEWHSRDALDYPRDLVATLSATGKEKFHKYFNQEVLKKDDQVNVVDLSAPTYTFLNGPENFDHVLAGAIKVTSDMSEELIDGADKLLESLLKMRELYSNNDPLAESTFNEATAIKDDLLDDLGYSTMPASKFDSSWADDLY